jgi:hypothetical protein
MKFLASALFVLLLVQVESASAQQQTWDKLAHLSTGSKIEVVDALSGPIRGQLVSIDDQGLTLRREGKGSGVTETIARSDVISVTVKRPNLKKIALFAGVGSAVGALAGGSRCKGPRDYNSVQGTSCHNSNGYYFDSTGGKIGAAAGAALGLVGFAFPEKKVLYDRSLLAKAGDSSSPTGVPDPARQKESSSLQSRLTSVGDKSPEPDAVVPAKTDCGTTQSEKGACRAAHE